MFLRGISVILFGNFSSFVQVKKILSRRLWFGEKKVFLEKRRKVSAECVLTRASRSAESEARDPTALLSQTHSTNQFAQPIKAREHTSIGQSEAPRSAYPPDPTVSFATRIWLNAPHPLLDVHNVENIPWPNHTLTRQR